MSLADSLRHARLAGEWGRVVDAIPFARMLGLRLETGPDSLCCVLPFAQQHIGNPVLPALHGGAIGGFMECAALLYMLWGGQALKVPKTIDFSIDFLRSGKPQDCRAGVQMVKLGQRVSHLRVEAWQAEPDRPIAVANINVLMR